MKMIIKTAKFVGVLGPLLVASWFMFGHFDSSAQTDARAKENEKKVEELVEIRINQETADGARRSLIKELCLNCTLKDINRCAKVGVSICE